MSASDQHSEPNWTPAEKVRMGIDSDSGEYGLQEDAHAALNGLLEQLEATEKALAFWVDRADHMEERLPDEKQYVRARGVLTPEYVIGQKPERFCRWLFEWLGARPEDLLDDLFPGSGAVTQAWERWRGQPSLLGPSRNELRARALENVELA